MNRAKKDMYREAYEMALDNLAGKLPSLAKQPLAGDEAISELRRRRPGFSDDEYSYALSIGYRDAHRA